jgi:PKD repeat protein
MLFGAFQSQSLASINISNSPSTASWAPRIAVDSQGNMYVVWLEVYSATGQTGDIFYTKFDTSAQSWSAPANLSASGVAASYSYMACDITRDDSDRVYVVWAESNVVKLKILSGGTWGSSILVANSSGSDHPRIAVGQGGDIYIIWWTTNGVVYSRARVGGTWEGTRTISRSGARSKFPSIAARGGSVYGAWVEKSSDYKAVYVTRNSGLNSSWSQPQALPSSGGSDEHTDVVIDTNGTAHFVWTPDFGGTRAVCYTYRTGSGFGPLQRISDQQMLHYPNLVVQGTNLYACWQIGAYGNGLRISYNIKQGGTWGGETAVPQSPGPTFSDIEVSPGGDAVYFVWDSHGEIYFASTGQAPPPPPGNQPPVADFGFSPSTGEYPLEVTFDGTSSYDPDGKVVSYAWTFGDGGTGAGDIVKHTYKKNGTFFIKLTVTDDKGATGSYTQPINILKPNIPPIAGFTFSPTTGICPLAVNFDASASHDPDGSVVSYAWNFGDSGTGSGKLTSYTYYKSGTFNITLTVTDDRGGTGAQTKTITVLALYSPLDVRWATFVDESLFQSRNVTEVDWVRNPQNDAIAAQIIGYRVYRKGVRDPVSAYKPVQVVDANTFFYRDFDVKEKDLYSYAVTTLDSQGHESLIEGATKTIRDSEKSRQSVRDLIKKT